MNRKRRDEVRRQTLNYLGNLICDMRDVDDGVYRDINDDPLAKEEIEYVEKIVEQEGMRLINRAKRSKT